MSSKGIMRRAPQLVLALAFIVSSAFAQTPPADNRDDLDVTMRVIVDPNAKVPDEIVRKIPLPKPGQPTGPPAKDKDKANESGKPADAGAQGQQRATEARDQGREFGEQVSDQAKQRSEEARRNKDPPAPPRGPPDSPPGRPTPPPQPPGR